MVKRNLPTNCLSVFNHFVGFALKGLSGICIDVISVCQTKETPYLFVLTNGLNI